MFVYISYTIFFAYFQTLVSHIVINDVVMWTLKKIFKTAAVEKLLEEKRAVPWKRYLILSADKTQVTNGHFRI